jgi:hypothetical protein
MEHLNYNDAKLTNYYIEMTNENNDGWWKQYFSELYFKRLNFLEKN